MCAMYFGLILQYTCTVFSRLNAGGVYLKLGLVDPAFIRTQRLFGARRLFIKCIFQYWKFIEPRTKIQQKRLKKCETMSSTLSHLSESGKLLKKKNITDRNSD